MSFCVQGLQFLKKPKNQISFHGHFKWSSWDFLSPLILQKMKEDNISQLVDYNAPFFEQQYKHGSFYILLFKF